VVDCDIDVACGVVDVNRVASVAERGIVKVGDESVIYNGVVAWEERCWTRVCVAGKCVQNCNLLQCQGDFL
jgi:hypothetical protein